MNKEELNNSIVRLIQSPDNLQEFADLASPEENWRLIDKSIKIPHHIGLKEEDCPVCFEPVRLIFDKFSTVNTNIPLTCPNCHSALIVKLEFTGYTSDICLTEE